MEGEDEVREWCQENGLSEGTFQVLRQEGFTSLALLRLLTPEEVDKWLKQPRLLPLAQSLALQRAVSLLTAGTHCREEGTEITLPPASLPLPGRPQQHHTGASAIQPPQHRHPQQRHLQQQQREEPEDTPYGSWTDAVADASTVFMGACARDHSSSSLEAVKDTFPPEQYRFLLVGKTGSGKSKTGNSILGAELFDEDVAFDSLTSRSQLKRRVVHGKCIEIMDCPGLFDTRRTHEEISADIVKAVACMHPGPHAILYVIRLGRYTEEEYEVYTRLKALFDHHVTNYVIVVFTGGDVLEKEGKELEEVLHKVPGSLRKVLEECQQRVVAFNNVAHDTQPYVQQLLQQVERLLHSNGGGFYTCPRYAEVGRGVEEEVTRRLMEMERQHLAHKPYVQELNTQATSLQEELQEARRLFDQREQERQLRTKADEERSEAEIRALLENMKTKDCSMEQQKEEREKLLERHEREREERRKEMERQREQERTELERKEREFRTVARKAEESQRRALEDQRRVYEEKIAQMKDNIAKDQEPGFLSKALGKIRGVLDSIMSIVSKDSISAVTALFKGNKE